MLFLFGVATISSCGNSEETRYAEALRHDLDEIVGEYAASGALSGTLAVNKKGAEYARGIGIADETSITPNTSDTVFLIASVSKQFVASAILKLEEQGRLRAEDPLHNHLPEYPKQNLTGNDGREVTLHNLLTHTSGVPDAYSTEAIQPKFFQQPIGFSELLDAITPFPLTFSPGSSFEYSNTGYVLLGEVVRRASGVSFGVFMSQSFFEPMRMTHTTVGPPPDTATVAKSYLKVGRQRFDFLTASGIKEPHVTDVFTDGNIYTTAPELVAWARKLAAGRILSAGSTVKMFTPFLSHYGYGWAIYSDSDGRLVYEHGGEWIGYQTFVRVYPENDVSWAYLSNQNIDPNDGEVFSRRLTEAIFAP